MALSMVVMTLPATAYAEKETTWAEEVQKKEEVLGAEISFESGSGTKDDPYIIATALQLAKLSADVNSGVGGKTHSKQYFKLKNDIDLSGHRWIPIGAGNVIESRAFSAYFNGNNKTITGLYVDERGNNTCAGLFGRVNAPSDNPIIYDLNIEDAMVYTGNATSDVNIYSAGILVGGMTCLGGSSTKVIIRNCTVSGTVESPMYAGGLVGYGCYNDIENCSVDATVKGHATAGGFAGYLFKGILEKCVSKGTIISKGWSTGGFMGYADSITVRECQSYVDITANDWNLGGFSGFNYNATVENSIAYGNVTSNLKYENIKTGGFVGTNQESTVKNCYALGKITYSNEAGGIGGFVGYDVAGKTEKCYYDAILNPNVCAIGNIYDIESSSKEDILYNICEQINGKHDLEKVEAKPATETEDGNIEYWVCKVCNKYFSDDKATKVLEAKDVIIPKKEKPEQKPENSAPTPEAPKDVTSNQIASVELSTKTYTYNGKVKTPGVIVKDNAGNTLKNGTDYTLDYAKGRKNVGKYAVNVTFKGKYSGTKTVEFNIVPKNTKIKSTIGQKKSFTIKWAKQKKQTTGYQIQYSTKSSFKNAKTVTVKKNGTTSKKITKCKGSKKYYVRIRTYKNVKINGKTTKIVSAWSKAKTVKTK